MTRRRQVATHFLAIVLVSVLFSLSCGVTQPRYERYGKPKEPPQRGEQPDPGSATEEMDQDGNELEVVSPKTIEFMLSVRTSPQWIDPNELQVVLSCKSESGELIEETLKSQDRPWPLPQATLETLKDSIDDKCVACHNSLFALGGLDLASQPFSSVAREDLEEIFFVMTQRVLDQQNPMPPQGGSESLKDGFRYWAESDFAITVEETRPTWTYRGTLNLQDSDTIRSCESIIRDHSTELARLPVAVAQHPSSQKENAVIEL